MNRHHVPGGALCSVCCVALTDQAVGTIREVMESDDTQPAQKVAAARVVLDQAFRVTQIEALEERIEELEEEVRQSKTKGRGYASF